MLGVVQKVQDQTSFYSGLFFNMHKGVIQYTYIHILKKYDKGGRTIDGASPGLLT